MRPAILTLNAGSSSLKFAVFEDSEVLPALLRGEIENIENKPSLKVTDADGIVIIDAHPLPAPSYDDILAELLHWVDEHLDGYRVTAVGHRVVHGGAQFIEPQCVTPQLFSALEQLIPLAPLHQPHNLSPIRSIGLTHPALAQVVCFDTAFHHTMPKVAKRIALPQEYESQGVRRYGFHGLSYEYIAGQLRAVAPEVALKKVIVAHLGNGASLCALQNGQSVDTTMGFSALDGLVMGTRCGALDPGVVLYLTETLGLTPTAIEDLLYKKAGLLGVSGISGDMRVLLASLDSRAQDAIELFVFHVAKQIASLAASLQGLDGVVFTAGIGEHAVMVRERIGTAIRWLGVEIDKKTNASSAITISTAGSSVPVFVIPTNEELVIARHTRRILAAVSGSECR